MTDLANDESVATVARRACLSGHSAVLCAEINGDVGYLFFLAGELVHASSLDLEGEAAAVEILSWQAARLSWCERRWPRERSVTQDVAELLQRAAPGPTRTSQPPDSAEEPPAQSQARPATPSTSPPPEARFPTPAGVSRALFSPGFKNALSVDRAGRVSDMQGSHEHLKGVLHASTQLGDLLGAALGLGPLIAAEASSSGFHRLVARSSQGGAAAETAGGSALLTARAFLKL